LEKKRDRKIERKIENRGRERKKTRIDTNYSVANSSSISSSLSNQTTPPLPSTITNTSTFSIQTPQPIPTSKYLTKKRTQEEQTELEIRKETQTYHLLHTTQTNPPLITKKSKREKRDLPPPYNTGTPP
jgi:hypothetical protein